MSRTSLISVLALGTLVVSAASAVAQTPTEEQQKALRANCPSDFGHYCAGVPTGGMDALVCLEKNVNSLSPGCKAAVEDIGSRAASASGGAATTETLAQPPAASSPPPASSSPPPAAASAPAAPPASGQADHEPQLTIRQEMALAAGACAVDFRLLCPNLPIGHGNVLFCLRVHSERLAPACREALVKANVPLR